MMDDKSMGISTDKLKLKNPLDNEHKFYMVIETSGSNQKHDDEKLSSFVEKAMSTDLVQDGTLSGDPTKIQVSPFFSSSSSFLSFSLHLSHHIFYFFF